MTPDQERFQTLLEDHKKILYKICRSYCRNPADRDDLAQEIVVQLWRSFPRFDQRVRFSTWMYRIALNVAISSYRRDSVRTRHVVPGSEHLLKVVDATSSPREEIDALYRWIEALPPLDKALVILYLDGNSYLEIADVLGISQTNVATKISRIKDTLRRESDQKSGVTHGTR